MYFSLIHVGNIWTATGFYVAHTTICYKYFLLDQESFDGGILALW